MNKRLFVIVLAVLLVISCGLFAGCESVPEIEAVKTLEQNFGSGTPELQPIKKQTAFIYKEPCRLSEGPELALYGQLGNSHANQIKSVLVLDEAKEADINDFVFEGQIYYHGWVYFNLTERNLYYNGKIYKLNYDYTFFDEYFWKQYEEYKGSYRFGDPLPERNFLSGTVVSTEDGCIIEPFADEPIAEFYERVETTIGGRVGSKITIEYVGYLEAAHIPKLRGTISSYDYDPDFQYEKSVPELTHLLTCGAYESEMLRYKSLPEQLEVDYGTGIYPEHIGRIDTYKQFKTYEQAYEGLFGQTYQKEFFKNNSLVFIHFQDGTGSNAFGYKNIYIEDETLYIELYNANMSGAQDTGIGDYSFSVALPKSAMRDVENIECIR